MLCSNKYNSTILIIVFLKKNLLDFLVFFVLMFYYFLFENLVCTDFYSLENHWFMLF